MLLNCKVMHAGGGGMLAFVTVQHRVCIPPKQFSSQVRGLLPSWPLGEPCIAPHDLSRKLLRELILCGWHRTAACEGSSTSSKLSGVQIGKNLGVSLYLWNSPGIISKRQQRTLHTFHIQGKCYLPPDLKHFNSSYFLLYYLLHVSPCSPFEIGCLHKNGEMFMSH